MKRHRNVGIMTMSPQGSFIRSLPVACLAALCGFAAATTTEEAAKYRVELVSAYVQGCTQMDELVRTTCSKIRQHMSAENRKLCDVPAHSFAARTARAYDDFKQLNRDVIRNNQASLDKLLAKTKRTFERDFAEVISGRTSMFDLERLQRDLGDRCITVEREWLAPGRVRP